MKSAGTVPQPPDCTEVRRIVLEAMDDERYEIGSMSLHASFDHLERQIDFNDILFGLKREWDACKADEFDYDNWQWKFKIFTEDIDERPIGIVFRLDQIDRRFFVVTRFPKDA